MKRVFLETPRTAEAENGITIQKRIIKSSYPMHFHSAFELEYVFEGEAVTYIDNIPHLLKPGSLKICTPLNVEHLKIQSTITLLNLNFTEAFINPDLLGDIASGFVVHDVDDRLITLLYDEINSKNVYGTLYQKNLLNLIILDIIRKKNSQLPQNDDNGANIAQQVALYIHLHYREHLTLKDISSRFSYTFNHLSKLFQTTFGMSITQYIQKTRLEQAEKLLMCSNLTVTEICNESGFSSISTFFRVFKQHKGISPKEFKRNIDIK